MNKYRKLKIGIIGGGYWATNIIKTLEDFKFQDVFIFEIEKKKNNILKKKFPYLKLINTIENFLKLKFDVVLLITPPSTHYNLAKKIIKKGNNIFIEKPTTLRSHHLKDLISLSKKNNKILMSGYIYCYNIYIKYIKKIIEKNALGKIKYIYCERSNLGPIRNDNSCIWDLASHDISTSNYLLNSQPTVRNVTKYNLLNNKLSDISSISLDYNKVKVEIKSSWINPEKIRKLVIVGKKKMLQFDEMEPHQKIKIYDKYASYPNIGKFKKSFFTPKANIYLGKTISPKIKFKSPMVCELEHLFHCIKNKKKPLTSGEYALKVMRIIEKIESKIN